MPKPLVVWTNHKFPEHLSNELRRQIGGAELVLAQSMASSNLTAAGADPGLATADIAFGQPDPAQVMNSPGVRWVHLSTAGYTRYDRDDFKAAIKGRGGAFTTSSAVFADPCAQHVLAMMLACARQLPAAWANQQNVRGWPYLEARVNSHLLTGQRVLILGFGAIARRLVDLLRPFDCEMIATRRTVKGNEPIGVVPVDQTDDLLPDADHVVNILPASDETRHFLNAARFARLKRTAILYNIGRGDTVDQDALVSALNNRQLAAAYLDVTSPEPLPPEHPLWAAPNCFITPHTAGGHANESARLLEHFLDNFRRFISGGTMRDRIV
ncbi:MAG TPA: D-2-hydroxyacid dehydrogenase [Tepidisphaeraceae bacterium]|nr:D-2-hydroxyacid dehydrogenase [Tepidisphaeraceae bacterium]